MTVWQIETLRISLPADTIKPIRNRLNDMRLVLLRQCDPIGDTRQDQSNVIGGISAAARASCARLRIPSSGLVFLRITVAHNSSSCVGSINPRIYASARARTPDPGNQLPADR